MLACGTLIETRVAVQREGELVAKCRLYSGRKMFADSPYLCSSSSLTPRCPPHLLSTGRVVRHAVQRPLALRLAGAGAARTFVRAAGAGFASWLSLSLSMLKLGLRCGGQGLLWFCCLAQGRALFCPLFLVGGEKGVLLFED